jgi:hypothetical protein
MPSVRRLTAILAADVAGYSRLMGVDEEETHERLTAHLRELVDPKRRNTMAAWSNIRATACSRNLRVSWMPFAALPRSGAG